MEECRTLAVTEDPVAPLTPTDRRALVRDVTLLRVPLRVTLQRGQTADALTAGAVDHEELAAPGAAVRAQPDPVEGETEDGARQAVLGHHRGDVRMMMLDRLRRNPELRGEPNGAARAVEIGMQVVHEQLGRDLQYREEMIDGPVQRPAGRRVVEIAHMLGEMSSTQHALWHVGRRATKRRSFKQFPHHCSRGYRPDPNVCAGYL